MRKTGRLVAVAAITAGAVGLGGGGAQGAESLIGKWHGALRVDDHGAVSTDPYTLWIRSTEPGTVAGKSASGDCVGRRVPIAPTAIAWWCGSRATAGSRCGPRIGGSAGPACSSASGNA